MPDHEKLAAIEKFLGHEDGLFPNWIIHPTQGAESSTISLVAFRDDLPLGEPQQVMRLSSSNIQLEDGELDEATKSKIRDWVTAVQSQCS